MTADLFVGFEKKPIGLEGFLRREKYTHAERLKRSECVLYTRPQNPWPQVFYDKHPLPVRDDEVPHWKKAGFRVVAEVNVNYHNSDLEAAEEAERLSEKLAKKFNGILYDTTLDSYIRI